MKGRRHMHLASIKRGKVPLSEKVARQLIVFIQENQLQQGDKLPNEKELMDQLNVSRSTIREAMRALSSRGIVVIKQGNGTYLSNLPGVTADPLGLSFKYDKKKVFMDLLELRLIMEPSIAAQSARCASDEDIREIVELAEQVSKRIHRRESHIDYDVAFHCKIAESTKNDILNVFFPEIAKGIHMFTELLEDRILEDVSLDHERIAGAIRERDTQKASNAMMLHLERNRYAIEEQLAQYESAETAENER